MQRGVKIMFIALLMIGTSLLIFNSYEFDGIKLLSSSLMSSSNPPKLECKCGEYKVTNSSECKKCGEGEFSTEGMNVCKRCPHNSLPSESHCTCLQYNGEGDIEIYVETSNQTLVIPKNTSALIMGVFFSARGDPQREFAHYSDCFDYIERWYDSIHQHEGLQGVLFHDEGISKAFADKYKTEKFSFLNVSNQFTEFFPAERRLLVWNNFITNYAENWEYIISTDVSDVTFQKNPLSFYSSFYNESEKNKEKELFFAFEKYANPGWLVENWKRCYPSSSKYPASKYSKTITPAMFSGKSASYKQYMNDVASELFSIQRRDIGVCDLLANLKVAYEKWILNPKRSSKVWIEGQPLYNKIKTKSGEPGEPMSVIKTYYIAHVHVPFSCEDD